MRRRQHLRAPAAPRPLPGARRLASLASKRREPDAEGRAELLRKTVHSVEELYAALREDVPQVETHTHETLWSDEADDLAEVSEGGDGLSSV